MLHPDHISNQHNHSQAILYHTQQPQSWTKHRSVHQVGYHSAVDESFFHLYLSIEEAATTTTIIGFLCCIARLFSSSSSCLSRLLCAPHSYRKLSKFLPFLGSTLSIFFIFSKERGVCEHEWTSLLARRARLRRVGRRFIQAQKIKI